ncbi:MAG: CYTH domain-containing protein [Panacagrimonas sp.]
MPLEIERKFLVVDDQWRSEVGRSLAFDQGYLCGEGGKASVRVRIEGQQARINIKAAVVGASRAEYEYPIDLAEAHQMLDNLCVGRLQKTRHYVERDGLTWEIDEFAAENAGLVIAEVELDREDQAVLLPDWLGQEVTDQRRYYNHQLALHPFRRWNAS